MFNDIGQIEDPAEDFEFQFHRMMKDLEEWQNEWEKELARQFPEPAKMSPRKTPLREATNSKGVRRSSYLQKMKREADERPKILRRRKRLRSENLREESIVMMGTIDRAA